MEGLINTQKPYVVVNNKDLKARHAQVKISVLSLICNVTLYETKFAVSQNFHMKNEENNTLCLMKLFWMCNKITHVQHIPDLGRFLINENPPIILK